MSHFLDDSPTTGLAACQVPRGLLGSYIMNKIGRAGLVNSEGPLKAPSLSDWVPSGHREALSETHPLKAGCPEEGRSSQSVSPQLRIPLPPLGPLS